MADDWIIDVLNDLGEFSRRNGMPLLHQQIHAAAEVAQHELSTLGCVVVGDVTRDARCSRQDRRRTEQSHHTG